MRVLFKLFVSAWMWLRQHVPAVTRWAIAIAEFLEDFAWILRYGNDQLKGVEDPTPRQVLLEMMRRNQLFSLSHHRRKDPLAYVNLCMDSRLNPNRSFGVKRGQIDVTRNPGATLGAETGAAYWVAIEKHGVRVAGQIVHDDCGAVQAVESGEAGRFVPNLEDDVRHRTQRLAQICELPYVAERIASGKLIVFEGRMSTDTGAVQIVKTWPAHEIGTMPKEYLFDGNEADFSCCSRE